MKQQKKYLYVLWGILRGIFRYYIPLPTSITGSVEIGNHSKIHPFCIIGNSFHDFKNPGKVTIESNVKVGSLSRIQVGEKSEINIGNNTSIGSNVRIIAQNRSKISIDNSVQICSEVKIIARNGSIYNIGAGTAINNGTRILPVEKGGGNLSIEKNCGIHEDNFFDLTGDVTMREESRTSREVFIHSHQHGTDRSELIWNQDIKVDSVYIGKGSWVGTRAQLLPGSYLGDGSILGAGGILTQKTGKFQILGGAPAEVLRER